MVEANIFHKLTNAELPKDINLLTKDKRHFRLGASDHLVKNCCAVVQVYGLTPKCAFNASQIHFN